MLSQHIKQRLHHAIDDFLLQLSCSNYSAGTVSGYRYDLRQFVALLERSSQSIHSFKQALYEKRLIDTISIRYQDNPQITPFTIRRYVCAYRSWIEYLIKIDILPPKFGRFCFELPKLPQILPKALPERFLRLLLSKNTDSNDCLSYRNRSMLKLMAFSGLRVSEVINLRLTDCSLSERKIKVFGKGSKERIVPITVDTAQSIERYFTLLKQSKIVRQTDTVFINSNGEKLHTSTIRRILVRQAEKVGYTGKITPHMLRHTCATHFAKQSKDLRFVQMLLEHQNIATTQVYVHLDYEYIGKMFDEYGFENHED